MLSDTAFTLDVYKRQAVYDGSAVVEGVTARLVPALADAETDTETYSCLLYTSYMQRIWGFLFQFT